MEGDAANRGPSLCLALRARERLFLLARSLILCLVRCSEFMPDSILGAIIGALIGTTPSDAQDSFRYDPRISENRI
jgi:hypothetical protein